MKLNEINIRDPFVLLHGNKYYMYGSRVGEQLGFDVYVSDDLENWSEPKVVFEALENFWGTKNFWAPEVHFYNEKFYMLASFKADDLCRGTSILVSDTPDGTFKVLNQRVTPLDWECLDGTLYIENDTPYVVFCHEWAQIYNGEVWGVELSKDLAKSVGEPFFLWRAGDAEWVSPLNTKDWGGAMAHYNDHLCYVTDGPYLYKSSDGKLKSLWSSFSKGNYVLAASTSQSGSVRGEWSIDKKLLFEKDGGHGMLFKTKEGKTMISLHSPNTNPNERPVFIEFNE